MNPFNLFINQQIVTPITVSLKKSYRAIAAVIVISLTFDVIAAGNVRSETQAGSKLLDQQTEQGAMREKVIAANPVSANQQSDFSAKLKARLNLTDEQAEQIEPILMAHIEKRMGVMQKHGISQGARSSGKQVGFRQLRGVKRDMDKINKQVERQLASVLNKEQLKEYKRIQEQQRAEMRARLQGKRR